MQDFLQNMSGKKIALITVVLLVLMGFVAIISFISVTNTARHSTPNNPGKIINQQNENPSLIISPTPTVSKKDLSKDYLTDYFAISYPTTWVGQEVYQLNGRTVTFTPLHSPSSNYSASFSISYDSDAASIESRIQPLLAKGFTEDITYIGGKKWSKASGTVTPVGSRGQPGPASEQESDFFIVSQGQTITIHYTYTGTTKDPATEEFFANILSTVVVF